MSERRFVWMRVAAGAIVVALLMVVSLFLSPVFAQVPPLPPLPPLPVDPTPTTSESTTTTTTTTTTTIDLPLQNESPHADANGPYSGTVGQSVQFSSAGSHDPDGGSITYVWRFGDGASSSLANPSHVYASAGNYSVTLEVRDNDGASTSDSTSATIQAAPTTTSAPSPTPTTTQAAVVPITTSTTTVPTTTLTTTATTPTTATTAATTTSGEVLGSAIAAPPDTSTTTLGPPPDGLFDVPFDLPEIEFNRITRPAQVWWDGTVGWFSGLSLYLQAGIIATVIGLGLFGLWKGVAVLGRRFWPIAERLLERVMAR